MKTKFIFTIAFVAFGLILFNSTKVAAATKTWDGDFNNSWTTPENWDGDTLPNAGDDLEFPIGASFITVDCTGVTDTYSSLSFGDNYNISCSSLHVSSSIFSSGSLSVTIDAQLILEGDLNISTGASADNISYQNGINLNGHNLVFDIGTGNNISIDGAIVGTGGITKYSGGNLYFNSTNTFTGALNISNGNLFLYATGATGNVANTITIGDVFMSSGFLVNVEDNAITTGSNVTINTSGTWRINNGYLQDINSFHGDGTLNVVTNAILNIGSSGDFDFYGNIDGAGTINKNQDTWIAFNGGGNFSGTVNINDGALFVNGNMSNANFVVDNSYLAGSGIVGTIAGTGFVSPGNNDYSVFNTGSSIVTIPSTITFAMQIDGTTQNSDYDQIIFGNDTNLNNSILSFNLGFVPTIGDVYDIFGTSSGSILGNFAGLPDGAFFMIGGYRFQISYTPTRVRVTAVATPNLSFNSFTINPTSATPGQPVTITLVLTGDSGMPTGTIEFFANGVSLGVATINGSGVAILTTSALPTGLVDISAIYSGDGTYDPALSGAGALSITVEAALANTGIRLRIDFMAITLLLALSGIIIYKKHE